MQKKCSWNRIQSFQTNNNKSINNKKNTFDTRNNKHDNT
jgi:hypothetical protein